MFALRFEVRGGLEKQAESPAVGEFVAWATPARPPALLLAQAATIAPR